jgi:protein-S-isoprenylcysteine O-methyltransferase Ste14
MQQSTSRRWPAVPAQQLPWVMAGKWYLLVRLLYQLCVVVVWVVTWLRQTTAVGWWTAAGLVLLAGGYALRRWARARLGERFRSFEIRREERGLETRGPYAYVRHPGYIGLAMMDFGLPLALGVAWMALLAIVPATILIHRARLETRLIARVYA